MNRTIQILVTVAVLGLFGLGIVKTSYAGEAPLIENVGTQVPTSFHLEVADTPEKRRKGLQGRASLPPFTGMIFTFPKAEKQCMWNKGVSFPLRVMFLVDTGEIVDSGVMPTGSETPVCSKVPVKLVVEINP